jgi:hypothetical protein
MRAHSLLLLIVLCVGSLPAAATSEVVRALDRASVP